MEKLPDPGVDHIVAEVSKNWGDSSPQKSMLRYGGPVGGEIDTVSTRLEKVWLANEERGFKMQDWQFSSVIDSQGKVITETVVALFSRKRPSVGEEFEHLTDSEGGDAVE